MKTIIELTQQDIVQIIANSFDCDTKDVALMVRNEIDGHGVMENTVTRCEARVIINKEGKHSYA